MLTFCADSCVSALPFGSDELTKRSTCRSQSACEQSHFSRGLTYRLGGANV